MNWYNKLGEWIDFRKKIIDAERTGFAPEKNGGTGDCMSHDKKLKLRKKRKKRKK